ncbi:MAG: FtsW/RodA/SpoVE family cell cycle protein [Treponema sp.]|nr:FtsW/RodA/SpoVE family cell cycle protein [Treponema sp.]MBQ4433973.1 FtsW/RodA/SpoVE family cell cycle protein [Bacteroidales bacterium]
MKNFKFFTDKPLARYRMADSAIIILTILLWGIGMFTLYFAVSGDAISKGWLSSEALAPVKKQFFSSVVGFVVMFLLSILRFELVKKYVPFIVLLSVALCFCTFIPHVGMKLNGARRWIRIPFIGSFQPTEAVKFSVVLYLARYFDHQYELPARDRKLVPAIFILFVLTGVVLMQKDFSSAAFVFMLGACIFIISGAKFGWIIPTGFIAVLLGVLFVSLNSYRLNRLIAFMHPEDAEANYQIIAAKRAITNGGFFGQGFGSGLSKTFRVPEVQSDCIFAAWGEAMGFLGVLIYFFVLFLFAWRCFRLSGRTVDRFASFFVFGYAICIVSQSVMNIAVVSGAIPTTGIPLPFFSSGGSSIVVTLAMCGLILNASRFTDVEDADSF